MDKQVKLIDADKLLDQARVGGNVTTYSELVEWIESGVLAPDPVPLPTIKQGETHTCPKCGNHNCFVTPINELNAEWFMCSFCNKPSPKEEWMEVSHD
ncbi:hypothetical protein D3C75_282120 [compost metagenome]